MSTHKIELLSLQDKARRAGRTANFFFDEEGRMDSVFYMDPKAPAMSHTRAGMILPLLSFAEMERPKKEWWQVEPPIDHTKPIFA